MQAAFLGIIALQGTAQRYDHNKKKSIMRTIRPEQPAEFAELYDFIRAAFRAAKVADGDEQDFTDRRRASGGYLPELALVAEEQGRIVGHILLTKYAVKLATGAEQELLLIAPLAVALEYRSKGVGAALMNEGLRRAKELGYKAALLIGDPAYYARFGFRPSTELGIRNIDGIPDFYVQAVELEAGALRDADATVTFAGL